MNKFRLKKNDTKSLRQIVNFLGNSQYKLNRSIILMNKLQQLAQQADLMSLDLSMKILDVQQNSRQVRMHISNLHNSSI